MFFRLWIERDYNALVVFNLSFIENKERQHRCKIVFKKTNKQNSTINKQLVNNAFLG